MRHRLDGPARIWYEVSGKIQFESYCINGVYLEDFEKYGSKIDNIFEYIQRYPQFANEIKLLITRNKWFNEDQMILFENLMLFK